jgi:hypothetical protein
MRADQWFDLRRRRRTGLLEWRLVKLLERIGVEWRLKLQHLSHPDGVMTLRGM